MNTSELVTKIAEGHGVSKSQAQAIVDSMLKNIMSAAAKGKEVKLPDLESSKSRKRRNARGAIRRAARKSKSLLPANSLIRRPRR